MSDQPRAVWRTADDIGQMRVRAEFLLHHAKSNAARNVATALLLLLEQEQAAWDAAPADHAGDVRAACGEPDPHKAEL